ncbi:MAG: hypothetical protein AAFR66_18915 [Bacteroidota bacterium]
MNKNVLTYVIIGLAGVFIYFRYFRRSTLQPIEGEMFYGSPNDPYQELRNNIGVWNTRSDDNGLFMYADQLAQELNLDTDFTYDAVTAYFKAYDLQYDGYYAKRLMDQEIRSWIQDNYGISTSNTAIGLML